MSTQLTTIENDDADFVGIPLRQILPSAKVIGADEIIVRSCCGAWNECQEDDLYVAIVGAEEDGHEFTHEAVARGAHAVVTERLLTTQRPQCIVNDTREAYGQICQALAGNPSQRLRTIGVSGSDGKTVTSHLIRSILMAAEQRTGLSSSIEVNFGRKKNAVPTREINAPRLAQQLSKMALANCENAVIELSSVSLAKRCLSGAELDVAVLTNIRQGKPGFHGSSQNYRRAQLRLLDHLKTDGVAIVNADDPTSHFLLERIQKPTLTFGLRQDANVTATLLDRSRSEQTFLLKAGTDSVVVKTHSVGDQYILNCLAATAVGLALGVDLVTIANGIGRLEKIPGRQERVECGQDFGVWIDSAQSPDQLATVLQNVRQITTGKIWCVASIDDQQSSEARQRMGEIVERAADVCALTKTTVDRMLDYEPFHQVLDGCDNPAQVEIIPNRFRAIEWALQQAQPGDGVVVTGCGEQPFALVGDESWTIGDRDVCEAWLYDQVSLLPSGDDPEPPIFNIDDYR